MAEKTRVIQRICQLSKEPPAFLANFPRKKLVDYQEHLLRTRKARAVSGCRN